jgi:hypothetical protein
MKDFDDIKIHGTKIKKNYGQYIHNEWGKKNRKGAYKSLQQPLAQL